MYRVEKDSLGDVLVAHDRYWGAQTQRALDNFRIGHHPIPQAFITIFAHHKAACALANGDLKLMGANLVNAIVQACDDIVRGQLNDHFPLGIWQTGSGTQTNMNLNEVIANRGNEILGHPLGAKSPIHPNDHVNLGQSSNDNFPTVMHASALLAMHTTMIPALRDVSAQLRTQAASCENLITIGRTHLQDATPIYLRQHFETFADHIDALEHQTTDIIKSLSFVPQGGTAVGNGLNTDKAFAGIFCQHMSQRLGVTLYPMKNPSSAMAHHEVFQRLAGWLTNVATTLMKIANDIRLLSSGPRCGFAELQLPANEPGSSIMPGKVNPTQIEALTMICAHVVGLGSTTTMASSHGHLQLNVFKPLIIHNTLESIHLLSEGIDSFIKHCLVGLTPNKAHLHKHLEQSLMLVTALSPHIGYDKSAAIALEAYHNNLSLKEAAVGLGYVTAQEFDLWVRPENMLGSC